MRLQEQKRKRNEKGTKKNERKRKEKTTKHKTNNGERMCTVHIYMQLIRYALAMERDVIAVALFRLFSNKTDGYRYDLPALTTTSAFFFLHLVYFGPAEIHFALVHTPCTHWFHCDLSLIHTKLRAQLLWYGCSYCRSFRLFTLVWIFFSHFSLSFAVFLRCDCCASFFFSFIRNYCCYYSTNCCKCSIF